MAPYFYLSYARADSGPLINRFYVDLVDAILIRLGEGEGEGIGFYEDTVYDRDSEWTPAAASALRTSALFVPLLSPSYLQDEHAGREWEIFKMRQELQASVRRHDVSAIKLQTPVTPVTWIAWQGPARDFLSNARELPEQGRPVLSMLKSMADSAKTYNTFILKLADDIIARQRLIQLPALPSIPPRKEVRNSFPHAKESVSSSPAIEERPDGEKYSIWVVDDESEFLSNVQQSCLYSDLFDVKAYRDPRAALRDVDMQIRQGAQLPDLFVVDLVFPKSPMQGVQLIEELSDKEQLLSAILAVSGQADGDTLYDCVVKSGATGALAKTLEGDLLSELEWWSKLGRNRRLRHADPHRKRDRVFLSYSGKDQRIAEFLARRLDFLGIGVWYAGDSLKLGDVWLPKIQEAFESARVFIPLITRNYAKSTHCRGELTRMLSIMQGNGPDRFLLTPAVHESSRPLLRDKLIAQCFNYHYKLMPREKFVHRTWDLANTIQKFLNLNRQSSFCPSPR